MIIIPTYNEKENIEPLVRAIRAQAGDIPVFFIDDSSPDGTAAEILRLASTDPNIRLLSRPAKAGLGRAYLEAFKIILAENSAEFIITMDGDLSHPAEKIPELIAALQDRDFAVGSRYIRGGSVANWNWPRRTISKIGNIAARLASGLAITDLTAGFVAYKTAALRDLDLGTIRSEGYAFQFEMKKRLLAAGKQGREIPIEFKERASGQSKLDRNIFAEALRFTLKTALHNPGLVSSFVLFLAAFGVYAWTAPHTIYLNDNAEFITTASTLGIPHPSGYPLYVLAAWLFSRLPLGSMPFRVNLFSAFFAALSLVVLKGLIKKFARPWLGGKADIFSAAAALVLAFSSIYWFQAVVAKVYPLNLFLMLLMFRYALNYQERRNSTDLLKLALVSGLAAANHQMSLLFLPILVPVLLPAREKLATWGKVIGFFIIGLLPYLYLLIRPQFHPLYDWGHIKNLSDFFRLIARSQYNDLSVASSVADKQRYLAAYWLTLWGELAPLCVLAFIGALALVKKYKFRLYLALGMLCANSVLIIALRSGSYSFEGSEFYSTYYLPSLAVITLLAATGMAWLFSKTRLLRPAGPILFAALAAFALASNFGSHNLNKFSFIENYYAAGLKNLPANSVLLFEVSNPAEDTALFSLAYEKDLQKIRPDIQIVSYIDVFPQQDNRAVDKIYQGYNPNVRQTELVAYARNHYPGRPLYSTFIYQDRQSVADSNGFFYRLSGAVPANQPQPLQPTPQEINNLAADFFGRQVLANYYYQTAAYLIKRDFNASQLALVQAIKYDQDPEGSQYHSYQSLRQTELAK